MMARTLAAALVLLAATAAPAQAGKLLEAAPQEMRAYADQAGYILASIAVCGGKPGEDEYFRDLARDNLRKLGADDDDIGFLDHYMAGTAETAKPPKRECGDDGAVPVTSKLFNHRAAIEKALKARQ